MSYSIVNNKDETLIEGIYCISLQYKHFNTETLVDSETKDKYSLEMIQKALEPLGLFYDFLPICIFDFLIGNTDRHQSNWALIRKDRKVRLSPLYDNSSSLCAYVAESKINQYLGSDLMLWKSLVDTKYEDEKLFSVFSSRLPDKKRKNIKEILKKYGLEDYDEYTLLKRSGARLPIDNLEFIDPILDGEKDLTRIFFVAGARHYLNCKGDDCLKAIEITRGDEIFLKRDLENIHDVDAVQMLDYLGRIIGYIPRYYSSSVSELLEANRKISCHVYNVDKRKNCNECVKVIMEISG